MLTAATLGMAGYAGYSIVMALVDLVWQSRVAAWADLAVLLFALLLLVGAAFVRVMIPGGLALALGALLGLQALAVHGDSHSAAGLALTPQLIRGAIAATLVLLAIVGAREQQRNGETAGTDSEAGAVDRRDVDRRP
jgi:hypothetical protein